MKNVSKDNLLKIYSAQIDKICRMCLDDDHGESAHKNYLINGIAVIQNINSQLSEAIDGEEK